MEFLELVQAYLGLLWDMFMWDIGVMSKPWMYSWLIPIFLFLMFFIIKWIVLTAPIWLTLGCAFAFAGWLLSLFKRGEKEVKES